MCMNFNSTRIFCSCVAANVLHVPVFVVQLLSSKIAGNIRIFIPKRNLQGSHSS